MKITKAQLNKINIFLFLIISSLGVYLAFVSGYGSDEDTLPLIGAFESMLGGQRIMASRFTPYPVAEIGIGFLSYQFGSWAANLITFSFIIAGCILFYISLKKKYDFRDLTLFLILCLSSPILFFDNIEPIDYSWAFFFLAGGTFFLKKKYFDLAVIFFGICIGTRINFVIFVLFIVYFFDFEEEEKRIRRILIFFGSFFIGGLFYLTIWYQHGFGLEWLTAVTPNNQGIFGLTARFIYKVIMTITSLSFIFLVLIFFYYLKKKKFKNFLYISNAKLICSLIISNLILFFFIPAELSYLQPMLIGMYFIIYNIFSKKIIYILIFINLISWVVEVDFLKIIHKSKNMCDNVEAIDANINIHLKHGRFYTYVNSRDKIKCWIKDDSIRSKKILSGDALKN